jgi:hypothetical protein
VGNSNGKKLTIRADTDMNKEDKDVWKYPPLIDGPSSFDSIGGAFKVTNIKFSASPGYLFSKTLIIP